MGNGGCRDTKGDNFSNNFGIESFLVFITLSIQNNLVCLHKRENKESKILNQI